MKHNPPDNPKNLPVETTIAQGVEISGPLPSASEFAGYEKTLAGAADRLLTIAEKEVEHRHTTDFKLINESISANKKGQIYSFIVSLVSLGGIFASILLDKPLGAIAPAIIALTSLAAVFIKK